MRDQRAGFALVTAMIVIALLSAIMLDASARSSAERTIATRLALDVRARAAARAGMAAVLQRFRALEADLLAHGTDPALADAWNDVDAFAREIGRVVLLNDAAYAVSVTDVGARLSLNHASINELTRLFAALGSPQSIANSMARDIVGVRDAMGGFAATEDVAALGLRDLPPGWREHLTVLGDGRVNFNTAGAAVLSSLPGMTPEAATAVLEHRNRGFWLHRVMDIDALIAGSAQAELRASFASLSGRAAFRPILLEVSSTGAIGDAATASITSVFSRGGIIRLISSEER